MKGKHTVNIPGELASVASNGVVTSADGVYDYNQNRTQEDINADTEGRLDGQDLKITKKLAEIDQKYDEFEDKTDEYFKQESAKNDKKINEGIAGVAKIPDNEILVVDSLPDTGKANTVYRVPGEHSYAEWAYRNNAWVKLAEYNNGIDDEPVAGSENLVKSGGILKFAENLNFVSFVGNNENFVDGSRIKLKPGIYSLNLTTTVWDYGTTNQNSNILNIGYYKDGVRNSITSVNYSEAASLSDIIRFSVPELDNEPYTDVVIGGRAAKGVLVTGMIQNEMRLYQNITYSSTIQYPDINAGECTITFPNDYSLIIAGKSVAITTEPILLWDKKSTTSLCLLLFNIITNSIYVKGYNTKIYDYELIIGSIRTTFTGDTESQRQFVSANLPFQYTVDGHAPFKKNSIAVESIDDFDKALNGKSNIFDVTLINPITGIIPNVDTVNNKLIFPSDSILIVGNKYFTLQATEVDLYADVVSSAIKYILNTNTGDINPRAYNYALQNYEVAIGVARIWNGGDVRSFIAANFPFNFTIDGELYEDWYKNKHISKRENYQIHFVGNDNSFESANVYGLIPGNTYRIYASTKNWEVAPNIQTSGFYWALYINKKNGERVITRGVQGDPTNKVEDYYDITLPEDLDFLEFGGRAAKGVKVYIEIQDITAIKEIASSLDIDNADIIRANGGIIELTNKFKSLVVRKGEYGNPNYGNKVCVLQFISDIHGDTNGLKRFLQLNTAFSDYIDDMIHGGDSVYDQFVNDNPFALVEGGEKVLNVMGNHDCWDVNNAEGDSVNQIVQPEKVFNKFVAPYKDIWGVTLAESAIANNHWYYHKDYEESKLRLIVLDCMHYTTEQDNWLKETLDECKNKDFHAVIAVHYCPASNDDIVSERECTFESITRPLSVQVLDQRAAATVQSAIDEGLKFVCWIFGHEHLDHFVHLSKYPKQYAISIDKVDSGNGWTSDSYREVGTRTVDCIDIIAIDTTIGVMTVMRIGNNKDKFMRYKNYMAFDYINSKVIANS